MHKVKQTISGSDPVLHPAMLPSLAMRAHARLLLLPNQHARYALLAGPALDKRRVQKEGHVTSA